MVVKLKKLAQIHMHSDDYKSTPIYLFVKDIQVDMNKFVFSRLGSFIMHGENHKTLQWTNKTV